MRRLKNLVNTSTGLDAEIWNEEDLELIKPSKSRKKSHKNQSSQKHTDPIVSDGGVSEPLSSSIPNPEEEAGKKNKAKKSDTKKGKELPGSVTSNPLEAKVSNKISNPKRKQKQSKQKLDEEGNILLDQVLNQMVEEGLILRDADEQENPFPESCFEKLVKLLAEFDPTKLDVRMERIRSFGIESVEDIGDSTGRHRRSTRNARAEEDASRIFIFGLHYSSFKFRASPFATPNHYRWPPYDSLGVSMQLRPSDSNSSDVSNQYELICDSGAYRNAEAARERCASEFGDINRLIGCLSLGAYHLPTLLQISTAMELAGHMVASYEALDVALYSVGVILSWIPFKETWLRRSIPYSARENRILFDVLRRGVHAALQRGCPRTAFEICRCVYSFDASDPCAMLLIMDYFALRSKRWMWLIQIRQSVVDCFANLPEIENKVNEQASVLNGIHETVMAFSEIPGFWFNAALSKYFLEQEMNLAKDEKNKGSTRKTLKELTEADNEVLKMTPSSELMLAEAMSRFPIAAVKLIQTILPSASDKGSNSQWDSSKLYQHISVEEEKLSHSTYSSVACQLAQFFVIRSSDIWKSPSAIEFVRRTLQSQKPVSLSDTTKSIVFSASETPKEDESTSNPWYFYTDISERFITGQRETLHVPGLLTDPEVREVLEEDEDGETQTEETITPIEQQILLRLDSIFLNVVPQNVISPTRRLRFYRSLLRQSNLGQELGINMETFNDEWNEEINTSLQSFLQRTGIPDPVSEGTSNEASNPGNNQESDEESTHFQDENFETPRSQE